MVQDIRSYIRRSLRSGYTPQLIRAVLAQNYQSEDIERILREEINLLQGEQPQFPIQWIILISAIFLAILLISLAFRTYKLEQAQIVQSQKSSQKPALQTIPNQTLQKIPASVSSGALSCDEYCGKIQAACKNNIQYDSELECIRYCEQSGVFHLGSRGETSGNTLACRIYHAEVAAATNPDLHCIHAGTSGGNVCGTYCDNYCALALNNCKDKLFSSFQECETACKQLSTQGIPGDTLGDSVQCRLYHLGVAGSQPPLSQNIHCPHGSIHNSKVCVSNTLATTQQSPSLQVQVIPSKLNILNISISSFAFVPNTINLSVGSTLVWTNEDTVPHTVVSTDGELNSSVLSLGQSFEHTFTKPGTYTYACGIHPEMIGTIVVTQVVTQ